MKKIKFKLSTAVLILSWSISTYASILPDENGDITINNVKKPMVEHINDVIHRDPHNSFKDTHIITYYSNIFVVAGTVTDCPKGCFDLITTNQYTYVPLYKMEKVMGFYEKFGAILVGHKDKNLAETLVLEQSRGLVFEARKNN